MTSKSEHCEQIEKMRSFVKGIRLEDPVTPVDVIANLKCLKALEMTLTSTVLL